MILSDNSLLSAIATRSLIVSPLKENQVQPSSIDLRLDRFILTEDDDKIDIFDEPYLLQPNEFVLGSTLEYVEFPNNLVGRVEGRSSIGRLGVMAHITAGFIDPGFCGNITLEIYNVSKKPFKMEYGARFCQLVVEMMDTPCMRPYGSEELGSKYQHSEGVIRSRYDEKIEF